MNNVTLRHDNTAGDRITVRVPQEISCFLPMGPQAWATRRDTIPPCHLSDPYRSGGYTLAGETREEYGLRLRRGIENICDEIRKSLLAEARRQGHLVD